MLPCKVDTSTFSSRGSGALLRTQSVRGRYRVLRFPSLSTQMPQSVRIPLLSNHDTDLDMEDLPWL